APSSRVWPPQSSAMKRSRTVDPPPTNALPTSAWAAASLATRCSASASSMSVVRSYRSVATSLMLSLSVVGGPGPRVAPEEAQHGIGLARVEVLDVTGALRHALPRGSRHGAAVGGRSHRAVRHGQRGVEGARRRRGVWIHRHRDAHEIGIPRGGVAQPAHLVGPTGTGLEALASTGAAGVPARRQRHAHGREARRALAIEHTRELWWEVLVATGGLPVLDTEHGAARG